MHTAGPLADHRLHAQGKAGFGARLLLHGNAPRGLLGFALGGVIADAHGWRAAFLICGAPGLALAIIAALTLFEPRVRALASDLAARRAATAQGTPFRDADSALMRKRTFWLVAFAAATKAFIGYGHVPFTASFFYRNHTEEIGQLAAFFGLGPSGFLGLALGLVVDRKSVV